MPNCAQCGKKMGFFDGQFSINSEGAAYFCSDDCKIKFREKKEIEKEMQKKGMIKEIKCKCNQCGKIWHYQESRVKEIEEDIFSNATVGLAGVTLFGMGVATQAKRNLEAQRDLLDKLKKCPECV